MKAHELIRNKLFLGAVKASNLQQQSATTHKIGLIYNIEAASDEPANINISYRKHNCNDDINFAANNTYLMIAVHCSAQQSHETFNITFDLKSIKIKTFNL